MSAQALTAALDYILQVVVETGQPSVSVTLHGGEPLLAGHEMWRLVLEGMVARFGREHLEVGIQSNVWLLDDRFCALFRRYGVKIGTSLDGPSEITDLQRGAGYFSKTMRGIRKAQDWKLGVGCIATFTSASMNRWQEVCDFFLRENLDFSIRVAVRPVFARAGFDGATEDPGPTWLTAPQQSSLVEACLEYYFRHHAEVQISSLRQLCTSVAWRKGSVCTFRDCLGLFLSIDPLGYLYHCQRLTGLPQYSLGNMYSKPSFASLLLSPFARQLIARQTKVDDSCRACAHFDYCRGGCPYNALSAGADIDPHCGAYWSIFDFLRAELDRELESPENLAEIVRAPWAGCGHPLLRKGPMIEVINSASPRRPRPGAV
jgi:uncharacterized protein